MSHEITPTAMKELRNVLFRWAIVLVTVGIFAVWATWRMSTAAGRLPEMGGIDRAVSETTEPAIEYWTCTMHPEIKLPDPGKCPICGMELVPKYAGSDVPGSKPDATPTTHRMHGEAPRDGETTREGEAPGEGEAPAEPPGAETSNPPWYRCTMPECGDVGSSDPESRCPVCGMKRERVESHGHEVGGVDLHLSERARRLAEVETEVATPRMLFKQIRTVGRVGYDETRYKMASAWIDGRIDKLFADFTGMTVSKGDHLVEIYSPELLSAQEEYLQALRSASAARESQSDVSRRSSEQVLRSAKRKLELLGVTASQIETLEQSGEPETRLVVYAPIGGTVVEKHVMEGMYVKTGNPLYTIADLEHLWLLVDLYEADLPWVKPFQEIRVATRSLPGEVFTGKIVFVDPKVDPRTRTVQVRIHVDNPAMRLKPDMWVTAEINAALGRGGVGTISAPAGAYACPMHPWESSDEPGPCPICAMDMVPVEEMPAYESFGEPEPILSVSRDAVMQTGERSLVYIETEPGTYHGAEVTVGSLAHDDAGREYYPVLSGLSGGERVVTRGNFAIDSQMQLSGKPSLFSRGGGAATEHQDHSMKSDDHEVVEDGGNVEDQQTLCPVMGNEINPELYTECHGVRVYFCCPPCKAKFEADPAKYIAKLPEAIGAKIEAAPAKEHGDD